VIILDNSVLSALKRLNALHLVKELFKNVVVPVRVHEEFTGRWSPAEFPARLRVEKLDFKLAEEAEKTELGIGEAQAIILAEHRNCLLALDDEKAREEAVKRGVIIAGSAGILRMAYEHCPIQTKEQLKKLLDKLAENLYLESWLVKWVLEGQKTKYY